MITFVQNKLGRDKTPEQMKKVGITTQHRIISGEEYVTALKTKLMEESLEVFEAKDREEIISELADVNEIIDALKKVYAISNQEIIEAQESKRTVRGGFELGMFIEKVTLEETNPWVAYFRASPEKNREE